MNIQYWKDRYEKQGEKAVGCCSFSEKEFEEKTIDASGRLFSFMMKNKIRGEKLLDFGCGYGRITGTYLPFCRQVFGIDVVPWAIEEAKDRYPTMNFYIFDGKKIPFSDGYFNVVLSWTVLQHIPKENIEKICGEIVRVMAPGALLVICENISVWHSDKSHIWFRSLDRYKTLFNRMKLFDGQIIKGADGNDEHHVLMVFKKEAFVPEFQDSTGDG